MKLNFKKLKVRWISEFINRNIFPYRTWIRMRTKSKDEYGEKLCYCGHTYKCTCGDPDKQCFKESVARGTIILWDENNGWTEFIDTGDCLQIDE